MTQTTTAQPTAETNLATDWNVLVRRTGEGWAPLWHTNRSEAEARSEYADRSGDVFLSAVADYRLVQGARMHWDEVPARFRGFGNRTYTVPEMVLDSEGITHAEYLR